MAGGRQHLSHSGLHLLGPGAGKTYRGSRKRLRRIKWHEYTPVEFWIYLVLLLVALLIVIPWLIKHPPSGHHHGTDAIVGAH